MSMFAGLGIGAAGLGLSALGNAFGASSANRAGRQARDWYGQQTGQGAARYASQLYGAPNTQNWMNAGLGDQNAQQALNDASGGSLVQQANQIVGVAGGGQDQARQAQLWNYLQGIYGGGQGQLLGAYQRSGDQQMAQFESGAGQMGQTVNDYGKGQEEIINRDAAKQNRSMDRTSLARLYSSGLGNSTAVANQLSGNARRVGEQRQNSLADLNERVTNKRLGVQGDILSQRTNLLGNIYGQQNQALGGELTARRGLETTMAGQDLGMRDQNTNRLLQALSSRLNLVNSGSQASTLNPWLGQNTTSYYPGVSGAGAAAQTGGNALGALGGNMMAQGNFSDMLRQLVQSGQNWNQYRGIDGRS